MRQTGDCGALQKMITTCTDRNYKRTQNVKKETRTSDTTTGTCRTQKRGRQLPIFSCDLLPNLLKEDGTNADTVNRVTNKAIITAFIIV